MKIAVFPGSFDPITLGHIDILERALPLFDKIIVALGINSTKKYYFPLEKRLELLSASLGNNPKLEISTYQNLTVDYCHQRSAKFMLRGIRNSTDFNYENTISQLNKVIGDIETIFLISSAKYSFYSSTIVREILKGGGDASPFLPPAAFKLI